MKTMDDIKPIIFTESQQSAYDKLIDFVSNEICRVFILKGYAGTGKTTLMKTLIESLNKDNKPFRLLASTGRAAKILSNATGFDAHTIHGIIYKYNGLNLDLDEVVKKRESSKIDDTGQLFLNFNLCLAKDTNLTIYIVDESSMISDIEDKTATQALFGSGRLLRDLLEYDKNGKFIFVGDICQLPPVSQKKSPALNPEYLRTTFGFTVDEAELTDVVRQSKGNDIVVSAQKVRKLYYNPQPYKWAKFPFKGYKNIHLLNNQMELVSQYIDDVKTSGYNEATLIGYSNRQCNVLTRLIRPSLGLSSPTLSIGDLLLITQNNYISGLMNGDQVVVEDVSIQERRAGLTFVKVTVKELFTGKPYTQFIISEILYNNQTNLTQPQQKELLIDFYYRMRDKGIRQQSDQFNEMMMKDPYLNAIRAIYGYALTCHKAQGGEWNRVYLDIPRNLPGVEKPYVYQWVYTAMTRAKTEIFTADDFWVM